jgi:predicted AAA+ superfamily ATPase
MRGRSLAWELFPFSFAEFLDWKDVDRSVMTSKTRLIIQKTFDDYFQEGGFPETAGLSAKARMMVHQEYFRTILHRDISERNDAPHPRAILDMAHRIIGGIASLHSHNRLYDYLRTLGHSLEKDFVSSCLQWFEDAYFLFPVKLFDASVSRQNVNPRKMYCIDHALVRSVDSGILVNSGHLLENMIFIHLRRKTERIFYHRSADGHETDFIWLDRKGGKNAVQVCYSLLDPKTRKRELAAAFAAMKELRLKKCVIVSYGEEEEIRQGNLLVKIIPAWKYLLES